MTSWITRQDWTISCSTGIAGRIDRALTRSRKTPVHRMNTTKKAVSRRPAERRFQAAS